jgi:hypothetical protein
MYAIEDGDEEGGDLKGTALVILSTIFSSLSHSLTHSLHVCELGWPANVEKLLNNKMIIAILKCRQKLRFYRKKTLNDPLWSPSLMACVICR